MKKYKVLFWLLLLSMIAVFPQKRATADCFKYSISKKQVWIQGAKVGGSLAALGATITGQAVLGHYFGVSVIPAQVMITFGDILLAATSCETGSSFFNEYNEMCAASEAKNQLKTYWIDGEKHPLSEGQNALGELYAASLTEALRTSQDTPSLDILDIYYNILIRGLENEELCPGGQFKNFEGIKSWIRSGSHPYASRKFKIIEDADFLQFRNAKLRRAGSELSLLRPLSSQLHEKMIASQRISQLASSSSASELLGKLRAELDRLELQRRDLQQIIGETERSLRNSPVEVAEHESKFFEKNLVQYRNQISQLNENISKQTRDYSGVLEEVNKNKSVQNAQTQLRADLLSEFFDEVGKLLQLYPVENSDLYNEEAELLELGISAS